jgi:hypothetical protein
MWHTWREKVFTGFWLGGPKVKRPLGSPRHRWEYNIKMDLREIGMDGADCCVILSTITKHTTSVNKTILLQADYFFCNMFQHEYVIHRS